MRKLKQGTKLGDVVELSPSAPKLKDSDEVTFLGMADVSEEGRIIRNEAKKYADVRNGFTSFKDSDVLVAKITPCFENGKGALVSNLINGMGFGSTEFHVLRPSTKIDPYYLLSITQSHPFRTLGESKMTGSAGQKRVPSDFIRGYKIYLPSIAKQKKIAAILRTWDKGIEKLNRLVAQKERRIQYICASLINKAGYERKPIDQIAIETSDRNRNEAITRVLSVTNKNGFVLPEEQFQRRVASEDVSHYKIVRRGEYAYNPSRINVGSIARLDNHEQGVLSPMYVTFALNAKKINSDYFLYWLSSSEARQRIIRSAQGSVRDSVGFNDFCSIKIPLPDLEKQKKIVSLLDTAEQEIFLLHKKLEKLKAQKRGLMQKLLTGEWPVRVEKEAV